MALAESDDQTKDEVQEADARVKAVTAAKTGNLQVRRLQGGALFYIPRRYSFLTVLLGL